MFQLFSRLKDPLRLHPDWAVSFAGAAATLPSEELAGAENIYVFVIGTKVYRYRKDHINRFNRCFFDVVWQRMKAGALDIDEPHRSLYLGDCERWQVHLKACSEAQRVAEQEAAETAKLKAKRRADHEAAEAAVSDRKASTKKATDEIAAPEKGDPQKRVMSPGCPVPERKGPVMERKPAGPLAKAATGGASGGGWRYDRLSFVGKEGSESGHEVFEKGRSSAWSAGKYQRR
ncbi:MAG TPA: hypothetical protein VE954_27050 [Oligoflexus sp.]|uniref:hypothetical protein n=1 Tax=Oligoflexus sp. TaxID=1971216 RepID=UPI002D27039B|nr:hypothetical protein [Oligoflexus sp.]HYX36782.1 hypothetical protein [Oligoflexus sp.]